MTAIPKSPHKVLVTGAGGQVGCSLKALKRPAVFLTKRDLDITDAFACRRVLDVYRPDIVINLAAYTDVDASESQRRTAYSINAMGPGWLADACRQHDAALIHISSDYIFSGNETDAPYAEHDHALPLNWYGMTKLMGEEKVRETLKHHIIIRSSWIFGPHKKNFAKTILGIAKMQGTIRVVNDQVGNPTPSEALAEAIWQVIDHIPADFRTSTNCADIWGTFNIAGSPHASWYDLAVELVSSAQIGCDMYWMKTSDFPTAADRPLNTFMDCSKAKRVFGIDIDWLKYLDGAASWV